MQANFLKSFGYLVSILSVAILGAVAWRSASDDGLRLALILGMGLSILGMVLRWLSYQAREKEEGNPTPISSTRAAPKS